MIGTSIAFFLIGILAYVLGAYGIAGMSVDIGKLMAIVFIILSIFNYLRSIASRTK